MKIIEALKKTDRTILEMHLGQMLFGIACQLAGMFFVQSIGWYSASLWLGIAFSLVAVVHMARTLERALPMGEAAGFHYSTRVQSIPLHLQLHQILRYSNLL